MDEVSIFEAWKSFEKAVVPKEAGPMQRHDMFVSFMGGATFTVLAHEMIASLPDDAVAIQFLSRLRAEVDLFNEKMGDQEKGNLQ